MTFNLGNISEDIIKDGRKQYENGLPEDGDISLLPTTLWGTVVPQNQALVYAFSSSGENRINQDVGLDGYDDLEESSIFNNFSDLQDPANDNYNYFLNTTGNIFERYMMYNGLDGNSPENISENIIKTPLILVLEGNELFDLVVSNVKYLSKIGYMPPSIVLGIRQDKLNQVYKDCEVDKNRGFLSDFSQNFMKAEIKRGPSNQLEQPIRFLQMCTFLSSEFWALSSGFWVLSSVF